MNDEKYVRTFDCITENLNFLDIALNPVKALKPNIPNAFVSPKQRMPIKKLLIDCESNERKGPI